MRAYVCVACAAWRARRGVRGVRASELVLCALVCVGASEEHVWHIAHTAQRYSVHEHWQTVEMRRSVIRCGAIGSENSLKANTQGQRQREGKPGLARPPSPTAIALLMLGTLRQGHSSTRAC